MTYEQSAHSEDLLEYDAEMKEYNACRETGAGTLMLWYIHNKKMKAARSSECEKMEDLCANWIAKHYRPITDCVENKGFIELVEFINHLENAVELPRRTCLTEHIREKATKRRECEPHFPFDFEFKFLN